MMAPEYLPLAFSNVDWAIVGFYLLVATIPGFICRKYIRGQADFLVAGRTLSVFLATATLTATEMGLVTVMYMAQQGFERGLSALTLGVIAGSATLFIGLTGFLVRGLRASGAATVAEFYEMRYSRGVRILGGAIIALAGILNYGVFLRVEAEFVRLITGIPDLEFRVGAEGGLSVSAYSPEDLTETGPAGAAGQADSIVVEDGVYRVSSVKLIMTVLVLIVLMYTLLGGMVSVVLTDYIQFIVLSLGMAVVTWWVWTHPGVGGFEGIFGAVETNRPGYGLNPLVVETTTTGVLGIGLVWIIWQMMHWLGTSTWQTQAFRTAATDSPQTAKTMWTLTAVNYFGRAVIPMVWGLGALAYFSSQMSPEELGGVDSLHAMPMFLSALPVGLVGLLLAGMLAALMSTHSSYLLAWSGVLTEDLLAPITKAITGWDIPQSWRIWITRAFILMLGAFLLLWGLWFQAPGTIWDYLAMTGTMYIAGASALIAMGLYWKRANARGAFFGLAAGALPGLIYLFLHITTLVIEPSVARLGEPPQTPIGQMSKALTVPWVGVMSFPLAFLGVVLGSWWGRQGTAATLQEKMT